MDPNEHQELKTLVASIDGLCCWYVSCGGAAGSTFQLALGNKVLRRIPIKNQAHSEEYRRFEGEANLLVWCCWRLDGPDAPLVSWDDANETVEKELARFIGAHIESVSLLPPAWDLTIRFSNGLHLRIFCDHLPGNPSFDGNWDLFLQGTQLCVGPGARYSIEAREDEGARDMAPPVDNSSVLDHAKGVPVP